MSTPYRVIYRGEVLDDLKKIPRNIQARIIRAIEERLQREPARYGTHLRRSLSGLWKIRVGDYRLIYEIASQRAVRVWIVGHRKIAYQEALRRWAHR